MLPLRSRLFPLVLSLTALAAAFPQAGAPPLSHAVPSSVHMFVSWRETAERAAIDDLYSRAAKRLWDSGILWDGFDLVTTKASAEQRERVRATVEKVLGALCKVEWGKGFGREGAFAFRFGMPFPEYVFLGRVPEAEVEPHLRNLRSLFGEIASLAPDHLEVRDGTTGGSGTTSLLIREAPFGLHLGSVKGTIVLAIGQSLFSSTLHLLADGGGQGSIGRAPSFEKALSFLPRERDEEGFVDIAGMCGVVTQGFGVAAASAGAKAPPFLGIVSAAFDELAAVGSTAWSERGTGNRLVHDEVVLFEPGSSSRFFPRLFGGGRAVEGLERFLPKEAVCGSAGAGCDPSAAYDALLEAVGNVEGGDELLEKWKALQARIGFDLRADLLTWLSGEHVSVRLPSLRAGSCGESVHMLKVKNPGEAGARVAGLLEKGAAFLRDRGQEVALEPVTGAEGLRTVALEAFPAFRPVVGVRGEWLVVASSAEAATKAWAAKEGKAPTILENERFRSLQLGLDGPVSAIGYADVERQLEGFAQLLTGLGFFTSLVPRDKETEPILKVGRILTKLGRFLREIDVERDRGGFLRPLKGAEGVQIRAVTTFRRPV